MSRYPVRMVQLHGSLMVSLGQNITNTYIPSLFLHRVYPFNVNVAIPSTKRPCKPLSSPEEKD